MRIDMTNALQTTQNGHEVSMDAIERVLVDGDVSKLTNEQRVLYYRQLCTSLGLNPLSRPLQYMVLQGKMTLYPTAGASFQIARNMGISFQVVKDDTDANLKIHTVIIRASDKSGRTAERKGVVSIDGLKGDALCNALMKCETKATRRAILAMGGLGMMDESEMETVPDARPVQVNIDTGEILDAPPAQPQQGYVKLATPNQVKAIYGIGKALGYSDEQMNRACQNRYGCKPTELAINQASELIDELKSRQAQPAQQPMQEPEAVDAPADAADEPF
jgi:hypothetical protein